MACDNVNDLVTGDLPSQLQLSTGGKRLTPKLTCRRKPQRGSWVGARRVALPHVSSRPPLRTGLTTCTVSGSAPAGGLRARTKPSFPLPQPPQGQSLPPWTACAFAASLGAGLSAGAGPAPGVRLPVGTACPPADSSAPAATPLRHRDGGQGLPLPTVHFPWPPARRCPCSPWQTHVARDRGRVALRAPSALCGSPVCAQRGGQVHLGDRGHARRAGGHGPSSHRACRIAGSTGCPRRHGLSGSAFPAGLDHASGDAPWRSSATPHLSGAWRSLMAPCRSLLLTAERGLGCFAPRAHGVPVYPRCYHMLPCRFTAHSDAGADVEASAARR